MYRPFSIMEQTTDARTYRERRLAELESMLDAGQWEAVRLGSFDLMQLGLEGLHYLQTYHRTMLRTLAVIAYLGWSAYVSLFIWRPLEQPGVSQMPSLWCSPNIIAFSFVALCYGRFILERSPISYYFYVLFPAYFWAKFFAQLGTPGVQFRVTYLGIPPLAGLLYAVITLGSLYSMVVCMSLRSKKAYGIKSP
jgi:GPI ethanolamine phosphate transferase 1